MPSPAPEEERPFFATAAKGCEGVLRDELRELGLPHVKADRGGVHFGLGRGRTLLTLGVATPVTGPRPMEVEGFVQLNFRF